MKLLAAGFVVGIGYAWYWRHARFLGADLRSMIERRWRE